MPISHVIKKNFLKSGRMKLSFFKNNLILLWKEKSVLFVLLPLGSGSHSISNGPGSPALAMADSYHEDCRLTPRSTMIMIYIYIYIYIYISIIFVFYKIF